ncbi:transglutaminase superfamily protein [Nocardioides albertanoniae]|uniref:Transglutaminase superfamily protein n=1 Tax=Nocardioides albertanoniae TaxID=1175486 RepID=A0A543ABN1_9ACTN|nr:lasso peptide biosynthesis B2 protein [Nocardioides albertanoniae]TQL69967.1 transglutaminase superfamily protein [Nocardioides albertanoniae]
MIRPAGWRPAELPWLVAALLLALVVEAGLRLLSLPRLAALLGVPLDLESAPAAPARNLLPARLQVRLHAVRRVLRHWPFGDTCLRHALVAGSLMRRLDPVLQVGVARSADEVRAHAWLLVNGAIIDPWFAVASYLPLAAPGQETRR